MSREPHARRLQERALYSDSLIEWMIERTEMYAEYNRQHPGYFDMMINTGESADWAGTAELLSGGGGGRRGRDTRPPLNIKS